MASSTPISFGGFSSGLANSRAAVDRHHWQPHASVQYIERYSNCLDCHRFAAMHLAGAAKEIRDVGSRRMKITAVGTWIRQ